MPDFARQGISPPKPLLANPTPELYPEDPSIPQGWGLTFFLHLRDSAVHGEGTGWWAGLPNLFWWADRKRVSLSFLFLFCFVLCCKQGVVGLRLRLVLTFLFLC
jgi:hypothetical protein